MISCELESYQSCWLRDCQNNGTIPLWFVPKENYFLNGVLTTIMPGKIYVAIIGVGNCASSLVQGVSKYREASDDGFIPGIMHTVLGGYHIGDINFVAAFDIDKNKVGKDLSEAIYAAPNNTARFFDVSPTGVKVERGMTHDGVGKYLADVVQNKWE